MKFKILLLALSLFTFSTSLFANPLIDSIGVKNNDGKKMILFKVKAGDTYYSIGHRYNIKAEVLMKFNGSKKQTLSIGKIVEVPTDQPFKKSKSKSKEKEAAEEPAPREEQQVATTQPTVQQPVVQQPVVQQPTPTPPQDTTPPTQYKVSAGETLYSIAKRFNTNVDNITKLNNLTSTSLSPGQILLVKPATPQQPVQQQQIVSEAQQVVAKRDSNLGTAISKDSSALAERHLNANKFGIYEKNEKGVATWIDDPSLDPNKKLVLHRTAPIGTVIKITNPMTNRTTFAKVVGRFTDSESTKDCIIVMTKNVADSLGALDKRFHVNISYGSPNE